MRTGFIIAAIAIAALLSACGGPAASWLRGDPSTPVVTPGVADNGG